MRQQPHHEHIPTALLHALQRALPHLPAPILPRQATTLPAAPGTYLLLMKWDEDLPLSGRFRGHTLPPGHYLYAGSARGPGGLRARLSRHLKRRKKIRWHVDQLTTRSGFICALPFPDAPEPAHKLQSGAEHQPEPVPPPEPESNTSECQLASLLLNAGFSHPLPGFGSSDCSSCNSHLLRWQEER